MGQSRRTFLLNWSLNLRGLIKPIVNCLERNSSHRASSVAFCRDIKGKKYPGWQLQEEVEQASSLTEANAAVSWVILTSCL